MVLTERPGAAPPGAHASSTAWLDLVRVVAIVAVVVIHVVAPVVETSTTARGSATWWAADVLNAGLRWCVPVFVMVSGALLLEPAKRMTVRGFYARRLQRVAVPLVAWTAFYLVVFRSGWSAGRAAESVLAGSPFLQLYFLFVICGLYVVTPFLRVLTLHAPRRMMVGFTGVMLALGTVDQALSMLGGVGEPNAVTRFLPYIGYFVAGWLLRDWLPTGPRLAGCAAALLLAWAAIAGTAGAATAATGWGRYGQYVYGFLNPLVVVQSLAAYVLLHHLAVRWRRLSGPAARVRLARASALTFGVFLVHPTVLNPLRAVTGIPDGVLPMLATVTALSVVVVLASAALTALLRRTPYLRATV